MRARGAGRMRPFGRARIVRPSGGSGRRRANVTGVRPLIEERMQRGIARLTIVRAVRLVAMVAITLALVAAVLETLVDSGINGFNNALWWRS